MLIGKNLVKDRVKITFSEVFLHRPKDTLYTIYCGGALASANENRPQRDKMAAAGKAQKGKSGFLHKVCMNMSIR